ncbi:hypothetical protein ACDA63_17035 [Uliginosibacterium sp. sgz301328]|uniref:hypothetical protein n=1 Tax=Uliginosibacterium sp. sgz301328 TaxID=3243764 RepID=UPI00359DD680
MDESSELIKRLALLEDDILLARWRQGGFAEAARPYAEAELARRGLDPHRDVLAVQSEPEGSAEVVTIYAAATVTDANVLCAMLESEGIPAWVPDANTAQFDRLYAVALGWSRVQVPAACEAQARELVAAFGQGALAVADEADDTSAGSGEALADARRRTRYRFMALAVVLVAVYKLVLGAVLAHQLAAVPHMAFLAVALPAAFAIGAALLVFGRAAAVGVFTGYALASLGLTLGMQQDIGTAWAAILWDAGPAAVIAWCARGWQRLGYLAPVRAG